MIQINIQTAPIRALQSALGESIRTAITRTGDIQQFAAEAGLNRATLYRLIRGQNVSTDFLLRVLRALGKTDVLSALILPPEETPLEKYRKQQPARGKNSQEPLPIVSRPVFDGLKLGRKKDGSYE